MINPIVEINDKTYYIVKSSDVIEAPSSNGTKYWQGHVVFAYLKDTTEQNFYTCSSAWRSTKDGMSKVVWSQPYYAAETNVDRANYRDNEAQSYFEFDSMVLKQRDKRNADKPLPMLAQSFGKREKDIKYPCAVQPKFDGMRVLYNGEEAWSRGNKPIIPEVFTHLHFDTKGYIVDGELILPGNVKVNKTMEAAKKFREGISDQLLYRVYDVVEPDMPFDKRILLLDELVGQANNKNIILAETYQCQTRNEIMSHHATFTSRGFEGTMIRNLHGKYTINKRSADLQKHKDFTDGEFLIVDVIPAGGGSAAEVGKFVCQTDSGERFESTAMGSEEERKNYLSNKQNYIGKYAKIKYREMSGKNNVPFHSNVEEIRDTKEGGY